jgi:hypothetical protein
MGSAPNSGMRPRMLSGPLCAAALQADRARVRIFNGAGRTIPIWEPDRFCAPLVGATATVRALWDRPGFERAAEGALGARE